MEENRFSIAPLFAIVVGLVMVGLTIWQFTLPSTNPLVIMVILLGGGIVDCLIVALYRINNSPYPFSAASLPLGIMLLWTGVVILGCSIWYAIIIKSCMPAIIASILFIVLCIMAYTVLKD